MSADMQVPPATPLLSGRLVGWTGAAVLFATTAALFTVAMTWVVGLSGATPLFQADAALFVQHDPPTFVAEDLAGTRAVGVVAHFRSP